MHVLCAACDLDRGVDRANEIPDVGAEFSLFSGKLPSFLRKKGLDFEEIALSRLAVPNRLSTRQRRRNGWRHCCSRSTVTSG